MVGDAEPVQKIFLYEPFLSEDSDSDSEDEDEDEVREHIYDTEYYVNRRKERLLDIATSLTFAATFLFIWFDEKRQNPLYNTHCVFDYRLWGGVIVLYIVLLLHVASNWWKTS